MLKGLEFYPFKVVNLHNFQGTAPIFPASSRKSTKEKRDIPLEGMSQMARYQMEMVLQTSSRYSSMVFFMASASLIS